MTFKFVINVQQYNNKKKVKINQEPFWLTIIKGETEQYLKLYRSAQDLIPVKLNFKGEIIHNAQPGMYLKIKRSRHVVPISRRNEKRRREFVVKQY